MRRRDFIAAFGGAAAWQWAAHAQQPVMPMIGLLGSESLDLWAGRMRAFNQGLSETGYIEGRNVAIEYRWAEGHNDRLPALPLTARAACWSMPPRSARSAPDKPALAGRCS